MELDIWNWYLVFNVVGMEDLKLKTTHSILFELHEK